MARHMIDPSRRLLAQLILKVAVKVGRKIGLQMLQTELSCNPQIHSSSVRDTSSRYVAWKTSILSITFHFEQVQ